MRRCQMVPKLEPKVILKSLQAITDIQYLTICLLELEEDGFGPEKFFQCLVAENKDIAEKNLIGYALFFYTYSTWEGKSVYMEDLYVTPKERGQGIGVGLWREVVQVKSFQHFSKTFSYKCFPGWT